MIISDLTLLVIILIILILVSAYFSSSETAMMALNRYRLKHLAARKNKSAIQTQKLLEKPDRLISLILLSEAIIISLDTRHETARLSSRRSVKC